MQSAEVLALKHESRILRQDECPRILLSCYRARNSGPDITKERESVAGALNSAILESRAMPGKLPLEVVLATWHTPRSSSRDAKRFIQHINLGVLELFPSWGQFFLPSLFTLGRGVPSFAIFC